MSTIAHLTLAEYDRMVACGVFDRSPGRRLEFIRGEIREMTPIGSEHEVLVDRLTEWSFQAVPRGRVWVRVQNSIGLPALESAPEPDLAWVVRRDPRSGRYQNLQVYRGDDVIRPLAMPEATLIASTLWFPWDASA